MVSHGAPELTRRALIELAAHTDEAYEVILVDNGSDARTRTALGGLAGIRLMLNSENRGFGPASNQGAAVAQGRYLLFLNTDAFLHTGWFPPLAGALEAGDVAAVVPKLLNEDGSLQDAGVLLAQDGTVIVYGDGEPADDPRFGFRRFVDAGSAAVMLMRRDRFLELGGFDDRYAPAYYEDADLCMQIKAAGLGVLYEPAAAASHVRYGSGDPAMARALSERNRARFAERWVQQLTGRPRSFATPSPQAALTARDAGAWPHILVVPNWGATSTEPAWDPQRLADRLLTHWPQARLSWSCEATAEPSGQLHAGVESIPFTGPQWLDDRLFHYDVVLFHEPPDPLVMRTLDRTQPQAPRVELSTLATAPEAQLLHQLARAGILSSTHPNR
jgi:GT2 family glycosyltransferase